MMMHRVTNAAHQLVKPFVGGVKSVPFEFLISGIAAVWYSLALHRGGLFETHAPEVLSACALSFVGAFVLSALQRFGGIGQTERFVSTAILCALFAAMSGLVLDLSLHTNIWRLGLLVGALACVIPLTPLARSDSDEAMDVWRFTLNLTTRSIVGLAYGAAMFAATCVALVALGELFGVLRGSESVGQVAILLFVAFVPCFIASGLETMATESSIADSLSKSMLERAGKWLVAPALTAYLLIIYAYTGKVLLTGEAPENVLSPLALGAATLGLAAIFFFEPMVRKSRPDWFSHFVKWLPLGLLASLPLAAWAIWQRIDQHGFTEFRYFRLLLVVGFGLTFLVTPLVRRSRETFVLRIAPALFGVLFVFASIGPYSASAVSHGSQLNYLRDDLHTAGLDLRAGLADETLEDTPRELKESMASRLTYLRDSHGASTLAHLAGEDELDDIIARLEGYGYATPAPGADAAPRYASASTHHPIAVVRPSQMIGVTLYQGSLQEQNGWQVTLEGEQVEVSTGKRFLEADLEPLADGLEKQLGGGKTHLSIDRTISSAPLKSKNGEVRGQLFVRTAELRRADGWSITSMSVAVSVYE
jgi:hypothetical protein